MNTYDIAVIGSGPGGYAAAIRCAQLGMKTCIIEKYDTLGGTCLHVGCIPSKAMLDSSEHYFNAKNHFNEHGITLSHLEVNLAKIISRKEDVVKKNAEGLQFLMKKNKIEVLNGIASFSGTTTLHIKTKEGKSFEIEAKNIIIASGSKPAVIGSIRVDKERIITSTEALQLKEIPKHLIVVGGGAIGLELGSVYSRLGSKVTVIEYMDSIIPTMDRSLGSELQKILKQKGFEFYISHKLVSCENTQNKVILKIENNANERITLEGDYCLIAAGRKPYTDHLGLENIGLKTDKNGRIIVDKNLRTEIKNIFAIGDVISGPMLAHKAEEDGVFVAEIIAGQKSELHYHLIPGVVYTWPEVAAVGKTEKELKELNIKYKTGVFPFKASGRSRASGDTEGFVKVLADERTDEILGVHMIGPRVSDIISEACVAMSFRASAEDIGRSCHPHPTYSEAFKEACLAATENRAIHI